MILTLAQLQNTSPHPSHAPHSIWPPDLDLSCSSPCGQPYIPSQLSGTSPCIASGLLGGWDWVSLIFAFLLHFFSHYLAHSRDGKNTHLIENNSVKCIKHCFSSPDHAFADLGETGINDRDETFPGGGRGGLGTDSTSCSGWKLLPRFFPPVVFNNSELRRVYFQ